MLANFLNKLFGNKQSRDMKRMLPVIDDINAYFEEYQGLTEEALKAKTDEFRKRLDDGETLDELLPEAFAAIKEACRRHVGMSWNAAGVETSWEMVPYDVQMAGGIALHEGRIAEMGTGEGKTLVAVAPLYLNALGRRGAHLVTVNDYLARRDSEWMGRILEYMGLSVACLDLTEPNTAERRAAYDCDVTYGTNHEFGFDYLRDNMVSDAEQMVQQRGHNYGIVDEVDNILIDEARTPLIIAGPVDRSTHRYDEIKPIVFDLVKRQNELATRYLGEAEELLKRDPRSREAGIRLLQVQRSMPKHKRLTKLKGEAGIQALIEKVELEFMADKRMNEVDEEVYYAVDEKGHQIDLTDMGRHALAPENPKLWEIPDIVEEVAALDSGDFEVVQTTDDQHFLLNGRPEEREAARQEDGGYEISRHDGIIRIPADKVARVYPGTEVERPVRDMLKEQIRTEHAIQAEKLHNISQMLRAYTLYERDKEYVVQENKVVIVDEFTGRMMTGRRWSDGLHQAVEAKEGVEIETETQTLASVTLQNFFRMYKKLSGMTGTAETEAGEFTHTYQMDVCVIPPNRPTRRKDYDDVIYKTKREKYGAVIDEIKRMHAEKLPVLVGTVNVEVSELLSRMLKQEKLPHSVLNAKLHAQEAEVVRFAGQPGAITIATNMAGRGTDIKLHPDVVNGDEGGLQIIGTERHDARRIDRQLRGRAGRQGDPGSSRFFLSLEDDLMRLFGSERIARIMDRLGLQEGEEITHPLVTRAIESAQKKVESRNFETRKRTLDYDNVMNKQREAIYGLRREVLTGEDLRDLVLNVHADAIRAEINEFGDATRPTSEWDLEGMLHYLQRHIPYATTLPELKDEAASTDLDGFMRLVMSRIDEAYTQKEAELGPELLTRLARYVILRHLDDAWRDHLLAVDDLRESIGWRGLAQLDPLVEYQKEASLMFEELMFNLHKVVLENFFLTQPAMQAPPEQIVQAMEARVATEEELPPMEAYGPSDEEVLDALTSGLPGDEDDGGMFPGESSAPPPGRSGPRGRTQVQQPARSTGKVAPNSPCPCGSGKKYKKCHGAGKPE